MVDEASVLHVNLSEKGIWPYNGHGDPAHVGGAAAIGSNLNFLIPPGAGNAAYTYTILEHVIPVLTDFDLGHGKKSACLYH